MNLKIPYSPKREDLFLPGKRPEFFSAGPPKSEAALCAEFSRLAYCRKDSGFAFDQVRIQEVLADVGFTDYKFFESGGHSGGGGTHCFLAVRMAAEKDGNLAVVAFRGTDADDPTDLGDDADFILKSWERGGMVHTGFANALGEIRPALDRALASIHGRILFTGHSLGAAMATLVASAGDPDSPARAQVPPALYTFGSPRVGDPAFVATLKNVQSRRYVDCSDLVARLPPELLGYAHVGKPYYIRRDRKVTFNPTRVSMWVDRVRADGEYLVEYAWKPGNVGVRDLADHAPINYVWAVTADQP
jgi:hypothetical protein